MSAQDDFIKAYEKFADAIFRHCYYRIYERERAFELAQETFKKSWEYICQGNEVHNIRAFLYKVANNLVIDEVRKKKELSLDELREKGFDPKVEVAKSQEEEIDKNLAFSYIEQLEIQYREVVIMRYIDGLSPREISKILGESENVISVRIHRGVKKLKDILHHAHNI